MDFENELTSKILDPIHGTIRLTTLEIAFINHPLFQRLRNIKQNSFLYKVFPSAVHSRFEHSLGVLHLSSEILNNLRLNAIRYQKKYDDGHVFGHIDQIPKHNIQELRLAALMHDIGHGRYPTSLRVLCLVSTNSPMFSPRPTIQSLMY